MLDKVLEKLKKVKGLANFYILTRKDKLKILELEEPRNLGVRECLKKRFVLAMSHDSGFRKPAGKIIAEENGDIIFPPVPFPEVEEALSSSPCWRVDEFLRTKIKIKKEDATLIVGFDA